MFFSNIALRSVFQSLPCLKPAGRMSYRQNYWKTKVVGSGLGMSNLCKNLHKKNRGPPTPWPCPLRVVSVIWCVTRRNDGRNWDLPVEAVRKSLRLLHDLDGSEKIWLKLFLVDRAGAKENVWLATDLTGQLSQLVHGPQTF